MTAKTTGAKPATTRDILHETALKAPQSSGVYLWRNAEGTVIYVGKAKSLKSRLSSYFSGQQSVKTRLLISHANSIEYITTANEYDSITCTFTHHNENPLYIVVTGDGQDLGNGFTRSKRGF